MLRKTLVLLALAAAPALAAQQPTQQPAAAKPATHASQTADTSKTKHHSKSSKKAKPATAKPATAAPASHDTTKAKP
jgi:hypothetical protein